MFLTDSLIERSSTHPIYLSKVEISGADGFSNNFFSKILNPLLNTGDYTLEQLIQAVNIAKGKLESTEVFRHVSIGVHKDWINYNIAGTNYNKDRPLATKILIELVPTTLNVAQGFLNYNDEDHLNVRLNYANNNFNENAESVRLGVDYNPYKPNDSLSTTLSLRSSLADPRLKLFIDLTHRQENREWQGTALNASGGEIGLAYSRPGLATATGFALRKKATDLAVLNSSVFHRVSWQRLGLLNSQFPLNGVSLEANSELSSSEKTSFAKTDAVLRFYKSFVEDRVTFETIASAGAIVPLNGTIHQADKFYLGGRRTIRGFYKSAVSPDGGLHYGLVSATVLSSLGLPKSNALRFYGTGAVGSVGEKPGQNGVVSTGFGIRYVGEWASFDAGYHVGRRVDGEVGGIKSGFDMGLEVGASTI